MKLVSIFFLISLNTSIISQQFIVREPVRFLALGDSYTIGQSVDPEKSWPFQFVDYLKFSQVKVDTFAIIARTGWTTTNLKNAIKSANPSGKFNLVSLLIGVNNQYQGFDKQLYIIEFEELLKTAIEIAGAKEYVFVLSIPDYAYTPFGLANMDYISAEIDEYNAINKSITSKYNIAYFDITGISRLGIETPSLVAPDGLHPSGEMYKLWVDLIAKGIVVQDGITNLNEDLSIKGQGFTIIGDAQNKSIHIEPDPQFIQKGSTYYIYSLSGKLLRTDKITSKTTITLSNSGIYLYLIRSGNSEFRSKIVL
jgi:lysophospholipase L1-like esterase